MTEEQPKPPDDGLTTIERAAKVLMEKATADWAMAVNENIKANNGNIDLGGLFFNHNSMLMQFSVLLGLAFDDNPGLRERFYAACEKQFSEAAALVRKATLAKPGIIINQHGAKMNG